MAVIQDININVYAQPSEKRLRTFLTLSQNENGRLINFRILGAPLPSNCVATFSGTKPDGNVYSTTGTVTGNFVVVAEDMQMTAVAGVWDAKLDIINGTHNIMTALIRVVVDADVVDPDAIASDSQLQGLVAEAKYYAEEARIESFGAPLTAALKADMLDKTRVYVYTGSETGMTAGHWYYWNGSAWTDGGVYNAAALDTDKTLSVPDKAADGKATGDALALKVDKVTGKGLSTNDYTTAEKTKLSGIAEGATKVEIDSTLSTAGKAADAKKTGDEISQLMSDFTTTASKEDMLKSFPTDTASGAVASFADGANVPVKSLIVNIDPVQSGSGDPSPNNVRPISGWSEVNVTHTGANILDEEWEVGGIGASTGTNENSNDRIRTKNYIEIVPGATYYGHVPIGAIFVFFYDENKTFISPRVSGTNTSFTAPSNAKYMRLHTYTYGNTYNHDISINYPSTDHDYHPYSGQSINIALGQTVYGGKLDVLSGELVIDYAKITIDGSSTIGRTGSAVSSPVLIQVIPPANNIAFVDEKTIPRCLCGSYLPPTTAYGIYRSADLCIAINQAESCTSRRIWMRLPEVTTEAQAKTYLTNNPIEVVYPIYNPITVQLTPHEVTALLGSNNMWADSGDSEVVYRADPTLYIQRKIAEALS